MLRLFLQLAQSDIWFELGVEGMEGNMEFYVTARIVILYG